jgi:hypothetical protein
MSNGLNGRAANYAMSAISADCGKVGHIVKPVGYNNGRTPNRSAVAFAIKRVLRRGTKEIGVDWQFFQGTWAAKGPAGVYDEIPRNGQVGRQGP